jgi:predicted CopG family antitoxin
MDYVTQLQNEHKFFSDMLKRLEKKKKKTPGNGFAMMKCKEKIAELDAEFEKIDYATMVTYD